MISGLSLRRVVFQLPFAIVLLSVGTGPAALAAEPHVLSLEQCIAMALERNHRRPASRFAVAAAEAQHRQTLSGYWPHINFSAGYLRTDEPPNFLFPASRFYIPPQLITVPESSFQAPPVLFTIPANAFGPGFPAQDLQLPIGPQTIQVPSQSFGIPAQLFPVPEQDIKMMDEHSWFSSVSGQWLLWDGGMRRGMREQGRAGVDAAREDLRRTELEIIDSVTRLHYGAVMARQVLQVGQDTLARMEATLSLTETMYQEGAGTVKKTDYLDNKVMVETLRSAVALLEKNEALAQAALAYTIGLAWNESVRPAEETIPYQPVQADLPALVGEAYAFNPDWKRLEAGIRAAEGSVREVRSGHFPKVALKGELHRWWNDYTAGMATDVNKKGWSVGLGLEVPLFQGFLTQSRSREAAARLDKLREERILLQEGLGLQIRNAIIGLEAAQKRHDATLEAMNSAVENRDLNIRAYQNDLVATEDVIRAQLIDAFMSAQHYAMRYEHAELLSRLNLVVGTEVNRQLMKASHGSKP